MTVKDDIDKVGVLVRNAYVHGNVNEINAFIQYLLFPEKYFQR